MSRRASFEISGSPEQYIVPLLHRETMQMLQHVEPLMPPTSKVLDIGCGNQPLRNEITKRGWSYKSLDVAQNDFNTVDIIAKIDDDLHFDDQFDLLLCTEVLEHVAFWDKAFDNFYALTRKDGKVLITCPFFYPLHEEPHDYWRPTVYAFRKFAEQKGFSIIYSERAGTPWDVLGTLMNSVYITASPTSVMGWLRSRLFLWAFRFLKACIASHDATRYAQIEGNWYSSNIILLQKK